MVTETVRALRPTDEDRERVKGSVADIVEMVRSGGDAAVRRLTARLDGVDVEQARVPAAAIKRSLKETSPGVLRALETLTENLRATARETMPQPSRQVLAQGQIVSTRPMPVDRAGVYAPGGRAAYPSSAVMALVPAQVAGVKEIAVCSPPGPDGLPSHAVLAACSLAGVEEVYAIGGAQAVAAMALGTETIRPVDVLVGPGNAYVAIAKREVAQEGLVGVPSAFAGPSEVVVVADASVDPRYAAIDVIVQAEHGPDGLAWLVGWDEAVLEAVEGEIARLVQANPRRREIEGTFAAGGHVVIVDDAASAIAVSNAIAPEHLELMVRDPEALLPLVRHAGAVFTGMWSPASLGDYVAGPSHVLPTFGTARFGEALTVADFQKHVHVVTATEAGLRALGPHVVTLAEEEGLAAHAQSVGLRLEGRP